LSPTPAASWSRWLTWHDSWQGENSQIRLYSLLHTCALQQAQLLQQNSFTAALANHRSATYCAQVCSHRTCTTVLARRAQSCGCLLTLPARLQHVRAGPRSLVLIDELGRATSTADGVALSWAMAEYLLALGAHVLLATHFRCVRQHASQARGVTCRVLKDARLEVLLLSNNPAAGRNRVYARASVVKRQWQLAKFVRCHRRPTS
jgi:hypothetical protein